MLDFLVNLHTIHMYTKEVCILVPIVERIDALFFGHATRKEQQSLIHILAKLVKSNDELNTNGK